MLTDEGGEEHDDHGCNGAHGIKAFASFALEEAEHLDLEAIEADIRYARNTLALGIEESDDETQARIRSAATTLTAMLKGLSKPYPIAVSSAMLPTESGALAERPFSLPRGTKLYPSEMIPRDLGSPQTRNHASSRSR